MDDSMSVKIGFVWFVFALLSVLCSEAAQDGLTRLGRELPLTLRSLVMDLQYKLLSGEAGNEKGTGGRGDWEEIGHIVIRRDPRRTVEESITAHWVRDDTNKDRPWITRKHALVSSLNETSVASDASAVLSLRLVPSVTNSFPKEDANWVLQTSIPLRHLGSVQDRLGVITVHLTPDGVPIGMSYSPHPADGATLILDDQVQLSLPRTAAGAMPWPVVPRK
eukprot:GHVQ01012270.1.p2 GENE.GHVQ01012270.1~~GHVQ01012270.1.p2  ORF type:complete len:221 (+),score=34.01 GHVQ01012270.1:209-871(+)